MCNSACIQFAKSKLGKSDIKGKNVIEVGSLDVNGTLRPIVEAFEPASYTGVDLFEGPRVDIVCDAKDLLNIFAPERFDLLISTEMVEHVLDWAKIISNFKKILKPAGVLLITTRSKGFSYHGYPYDFWRYELEDMKKIFSDFEIISLEKDLEAPGIFIVARKPILFVENDLSHLNLYSMIKFRRDGKVTSLNIQTAKILYGIKRYLSDKCPASWKRVIKNVVSFFS
jgi:SAM-dependent methyltransferase